MAAEWIEVWCQGGEADDQRYMTMVEPPDEILMLRDPFHPEQWIRVVGPWAEAIPYQRQRAVEQIDNERIYYPVQRDEARDHSGESRGADGFEDGLRCKSCAGSDTESDGS